MTSAVVPKLSDKQGKYVSYKIAKAALVVEMILKWGASIFVMGGEKLDAKKLINLSMNKSIRCGGNYQGQRAT